MTVEPRLAIFEKKAKAFVHRYVYTPLGVTAVSIGSAGVGYKLGLAGVDINLDRVVDVTVLVTCACVVYQFMRPKGTRP